MVWALYAVGYEVSAQGTCYAVKLYQVQGIPQVVACFLVSGMFRVFTMGETRTRGHGKT